MSRMEVSLERVELPGEKHSTASTETDGKCDTKGQRSVSSRRSDNCSKDCSRSESEGRSRSPSGDDDDSTEDW